MDALNEGVSTSLGTGIIISTLFAIDLDLNCDFVFIMYSIRLLLCGSTTASTQIRGFTVKARYNDNGNYDDKNRNKLHAHQ